MKYKKLLIYSPTKQIFETALANKVADEFAIAFIEEPRMIWALGIYYPCPFTKEEITLMITELQEKDTELETLIHTLVDTLVKRSEMGTPEGVATLDNFGLVPIDLLFLKQADFYQFQDIAIIQDSTVTGEGQITFNTRSNKFVIVLRGAGIFTNWDNADEYGTASPEGRIPFPGKIYTCEKDGKSYIWNNTTLVETEIDESRIRPPYGIVKLDENYLVPYDQLPVEVYGELEFGDIINNYPDLFESGSAPLNPKFKDIIYCNMTSTFICRFLELGTENYKWYTNWPTSEMYGELTSNGIRPSMGVTYLDGLKHYLYQFNGHNLVKGDYIGIKRPVYSAIQGELLEEKVNENTLLINNVRNDITNLTNSKADKTELSNVIGEEVSDPILEEIDTTGVDKIKEILVTGSDDLYIADGNLALTTNKQFTIKGYFLGKRGNINVASSENTGVTPLLPLNKTYPIVLKNVIAFNTAVAVCFYDTAGSFISYPDGIEDLRGDFTVTLDKYPANACYFRACSEKAGSTYTNGPTQEAREGAVSEAIQESKLALFIDMWRRCYDCQYDATKAKPFTCNGVELTYQEARDVYNAPRIAYPYFTGANQLAVSAKTLILSSRYAPGSNVNLKYAFCNGAYTVIRISSDVDTLWVSNSEHTFGYCQQLEKILGKMRLEMTTSKEMFFQCVKLQEVKINHLSLDISFHHSPLLSLASLTYLVTYAANTDAITVTVHPDVYAKLTGDTTNAAAAALSADELAQWQALIAQAAEKQITFATT